MFSPPDTPFLKSGSFCQVSDQMWSPKSHVLAIRCGLPLVRCIHVSHPTPDCEWLEGEFLTHFYIYWDGSGPALLRSKFVYGSVSLDCKLLADRESLGCLTSRVQVQFALSKCQLMELLSEVFINPGHSKGSLKGTCYHHYQHRKKKNKKQR